MDLQHHADELSSDAIISAFIMSQLPYIVFNVMQDVHLPSNLVVVVPYRFWYVRVIVIILAQSLRLVGYVWAGKMEQSTPLNSLNNIVERCDYYFWDPNNSTLTLLN